MNLKYCFAAFFGLVGSLLPAQQPDLCFHHLRLKNGLSQSINSFVYQDSYGFVWVSALDGVNRFDGVNIEQFRPEGGSKDGMKGKLVHSEFFEAENTDIWFCTTEALNVYRRATGRFEHFSLDTFFPPERSLEYYGFHLDDKENFWLRVDKRVFLFNIFSEEIIELGDVSGLRINVFADNSGHMNIYALGKDQMAGGSHYRYSGTGKWESFGSLLSQLPHRYNLHDQWRASDGSFFFGTSQGLLHCDASGKPLHCYDEYKGEKVFNVWALEIEGDLIYLSSSIGILIFDQIEERFIGRYTHTDDDDLSLGRSEVQELHLDKAGNLWASLWMVGVDYGHPGKVKFRKFQPLVEDQGSDIDKRETLFDPGEIIQDRQGNIWCSSRQHGLMVFDALGERNHQIDHHQSLWGFLGKGGIHHLWEDRFGRIYLLPWRNFVIRYDPEQKQFLKIPVKETEASVLGRLIELTDGRILLTGQYASGLWELQEIEDEVSFVPLKNKAIEGQYYNTAHVTQRGHLLLTKTGGGIEVLTYQRGELVPVIDLNWEGETRSIVELTNGKVFFGGAYGLMQFNEDSLKVAPLSTGWDTQLSDIYAIEPEGDSALWLSSNYGLLRYDIAGENFRTFTATDGLQSREFNSNSSLTTTSGEMWFGGIRGYNIFRPEEIESNIPLAKANLVDLAINEKSLRDSLALVGPLDLQLKYWQNNLSFNFVASEYSDPDANLLRYRLNYIDGAPYDADWVTVNNSKGEIRYPQLPPGEYVFKVAASNSDGVWNPDLRTVYFNIATPFWQTVWFYLITIMAFIGGLVRYYRHRLYVKELQISEQNAYIEKEKALQAERDRLAKDMHDELGGGLTTIRLLLRKVKAKNPELKTGEELSRIDHYSSEIIKNMRFIVWALQRDNEQLENFAAYLRHSIGGLLEDHELEHGWRVSEELPDLLLTGTIRKNLWLCVKEATHNIIKHAEADFVAYRIDWDAQEGLLISVTDNGVGIPDLSEKIFGYGLKNMSDRMESIGGSADVRSVEGTTVTFQLPIATLSAT